MPGPFTIHHLAAAAAVACACLAFAVFGAPPASAATAGILPPRNPAADCDPASAQVQFTIQNLDGCRAKEGVGPLVLPSNWTALTGAEQLFVLVDLERVDRGLAPVVGLSRALNQLASAGARASDDPSFPHGGFVGGGGVWFGGESAIAADYAWMYDDGPNGFDINVDCPRSGSSLCWLHRDIILWKGTGGPLVAGGGSAPNSYAFQILSGYSQSDLMFTWAHELRYFSRKPGLEPSGPVAHTAKGAKRRKKHRRHHGSGGSSGATGGSGSSGGSGSTTIKITVG